MSDEGNEEQGRNEAKNDAKIKERAMNEGNEERGRNDAKNDAKTKERDRK